jgi:hypothetical protein
MIHMILTQATHFYFLGLSHCYYLYRSQQSQYQLHQMYQMEGSNLLLLTHWNHRIHQVL